MICESYYDAIRSATPSHIEAIDMGRRGLHNEGSQTLLDRLAWKDRHRFRHGAPPVHAGLRPALARLGPGSGIPPSRSILFMCGMNAVRSPMAEALAREALPASTFIASAGVRAGERDPFVDVVLAEVGLLVWTSVSPGTMDDLEDGFYFDLIITLAPQAHHAALELTRSTAVEVEYWPTADPTLVTRHPRSDHRSLSRRARAP